MTSDRAQLRGGQARDAVRLDGVTWRYRVQQKPTLTNLTLRIPEGQKIAIIGASGSGKSTVLQLMNGLIPHRVEGELDGTVRVFERSIQGREFTEISDEVGTVLQDTDAQFVGLTVAEDIAFALENLAVPEPELHRRVAETAERVRVTELMDASPRELSGGQRQRVSMGGVLAAGARMLLFDEPLASLDPASGLKSVELIDELWRSGSTVVIVEHRLEDVLHRPVDRIILMHDGQIVADDAPAALISSGILPKHGIREPLSVAALRFAGIAPRPEHHPDEPGAIQLRDDEISALATWVSEDSEPAAVATHPASLVRFDEVRFSRGERPVLGGVNFSIAPGEMVALCGPNGAGKSTIASLMCGFERPDAGRIFVADEDATAWPVAKRSERIGLVLQNPNDMISKHLIRDELLLGTHTLGLSETELNDRVDAALKACGLWKFRGWPISALSYGQKKRVTIAAMLVREPQLLILDEPTAGQDYRHASEFMDLIRELNESGMAILLITHDLHLALEYAPRMLVLSGGTLIADGDSADVFAKPDVLRQGDLKPTSLTPLASQLVERAGLDSRDASARLHRRFVRAERAARDARRQAEHGGEGSDG